MSTDELMPVVTDIILKFANEVQFEQLQQRYLAAGESVFPHLKDVFGPDVVYADVVKALHTQATATSKEVLQTFHDMTPEARIQQILATFFEMGGRDRFPEFAKLLEVKTEDDFQLFSANDKRLLMNTIKTLIATGIVQQLWSTGKVAGQAALANIGPHAERNLLVGGVVGAAVGTGLYYGNRMRLKRSKRRRTAQPATEMVLISSDHNPDPPQALPQTNAFSASTVGRHVSLFINRTRKGTEPCMRASCLPSGGLALGSNGKAVYIAQGDRWVRLNTAKLAPQTQRAASLIRHQHATARDDMAALLGEVLPTPV